jgi:peptide-methionine (S)-S-oxide reductase
MAEGRVMARATFAAGKFWLVEEAFRTTRGVSSTAVGYMGGTVENPMAEDMAGGATGHAEVVDIEYDPIKVTYQKLLDVFWACHDPTQMGRQGQNSGPQFRSVIFYHTPQQKATAEHSRSMVAGSRRFPRPVVTAIAPAETFWPAPDDDQRYIQKHGRGGYYVPPRRPAERG